MDKSSLIVIPCRMGSSRFPAKPLALIKGRMLMERVWRIAKVSCPHGRVILATDSEKIKQAALGFGAEVMLTSSTCLTGTDRVAETLSRVPEYYGIIVNLQGDAPLIPPWIIRQMIDEMQRDPSVQLATPIVRLEGRRALDLFAQKKNGSTSGTLVTFDKKRNALYFSKGVIPYPRDGIDSLSRLYLHIGLYAYRATTLKHLSALEEGQFEKVEKLEQLRALENGIPIRVVEVDLRGRTLASVDSPDDVKFVEAIIDREGELT